MTLGASRRDFNRLKNIPLSMTIILFKLERMRLKGGAYFFRAEIRLDKPIKFLRLRVEATMV